MTTPRTRRSGSAAGEAFDVSEMDPWNDDRCRDFVAINTIQRLRAYHLPASVTRMPEVELVNLVRSRNLLLLPRVLPDYRPCMNEQPGTRPRDSTSGRRGTAHWAHERRMQTSESSVPHAARPHTTAQHDETEAIEETSAPVTALLQDVPETAQSTPSLPISNSRIECNAPVTPLPFSSTSATPTQLIAPDSSSTGSLSPTHPGTPSPAVVLHSGGGELCALERARVLFFGAAAFSPVASTSPRSHVLHSLVRGTPSSTVPTSHSCALAPPPLSSELVREAAAAASEEEEVAIRSPTHVTIPTQLFANPPSLSPPSTPAHDSACMVVPPVKVEEEEDRATEQLNELSLVQDTDCTKPTGVVDYGKKRSEADEENEEKMVVTVQETKKWPCVHAIVQKGENANEHEKEEAHIGHLRCSNDTHATSKTEVAVENDVRQGTCVAESERAAGGVWLTNPEEGEGGVEGRLSSLLRVSALPSCNFHNRTSPLQPATAAATATTASVAARESQHKDTDAQTGVQTDVEQVCDSSKALIAQPMDHDLSPSAHTSLFRKDRPASDTHDAFHATHHAPCEDSPQTMPMNAHREPMTCSEPTIPHTPSLCRTPQTNSVTHCEVVDSLVAHFQGLLSRGVVLDRFSYKELVFAWWVLGRDMNTAALHTRGPARREGLLIHLRNFYYTLLSAPASGAARVAGISGGSSSTPRAPLAASPQAHVDSDAHSCFSRCRGREKDNSNEEDVETTGEGDGVRAVQTPRRTSPPRGRSLPSRPTPSALRPAAVARRDEQQQQQQHQPHVLKDDEDEQQQQHQQEQQAHHTCASSSSLPARLKRERAGEEYSLCSANSAGESPINKDTHLSRERLLSSPHSARITREQHDAVLDTSHTPHTSLQTHHPNPTQPSNMHTAHDADDCTTTTTPEDADLAPPRRAAPTRRYICAEERRRTLQQTWHSDRHATTRRRAAAAGAMSEFAEPHGRQRVRRRSGLSSTAAAADAVVTADNNDDDDDDGANAVADNDKEDEVNACGARRTRMASPRRLIGGRGVNAEEEVDRMSCEGGVAYNETADCAQERENEEMNTEKKEDGSDTQKGILLGRRHGLAGRAPRGMTTIDSDTITVKEETHDHDDSRKDEEHMNRVIGRLRHGRRRAFSRTADTSYATPASRSRAQVHTSAEEPRRGRGGRRWAASRAQGVRADATRERMNVTDHYSQTIKTEPHDDDVGQEDALAEGRNRRVRACRVEDGRVTDTSVSSLTEYTGNKNSNNNNNDDDEVEVDEEECASDKETTVTHGWRDHTSRAENEEEETTTMGAAHDLYSPVMNAETTEATTTTTTTRVRRRRRGVARVEPTPRRRRRRCAVAVLPSEETTAIRMPPTRRRRVRGAPLSTRRAGAPDERAPLPPSATLARSFSVSSACSASSAASSAVSAASLSSSSSSSTDSSASSSASLSPPPSPRWDAVDTRTFALRRTPAQAEAVARVRDRLCECNPVYTTLMMMRGDEEVQVQTAEAAAAAAAAVAEGAMHQGANVVRTGLVEHCTETEECAPNEAGCTGMYETDVDDCLLRGMSEEEKRRFVKFAAGERRGGVADCVMQSLRRRVGANVMTSLSSPSFSSSCNAPVSTLATRAHVFDDLSFAQQCLLVWQSSSLLAAHDRRRAAAMTRWQRHHQPRGMATRRMAAARGLQEMPLQSWSDLSEEEEDEKDEDSSSSSSSSSSSNNNAEDEEEIRCSRPSRDKNSESEEVSGPCVKDASSAGDGNHKRDVKKRRQDEFNRGVHHEKNECEDEKSGESALMREGGGVGQTRNAARRCVCHRDGEERLTPPARVYVDYWAEERRARECTRQQRSM